MTGKQEITYQPRKNGREAFKGLKNSLELTSYGGKELHFSSLIDKVRHVQSFEIAFAGAKKKITLRQPPLK